MKLEIILSDLTDVVSFDQSQLGLRSLIKSSSQPFDVKDRQGGRVPWVGVVVAIFVT